MENDKQNIKFEVRHSGWLNFQRPPTTGVQLLRTVIRKNNIFVDYVLNEGNVAIEIKGTSRVDRSEIRGLLAYRESYRPEKAIVICNESRARITEGIEVLPWKEALRKLWEGKII